jgi:GTP-dependent phosphoenolpyruvate carboxykinase
VQLPQIHQHFAGFGDALPDELHRQLEVLEQRLSG